MDSRFLVSLSVSIIKFCPDSKFSLSLVIRELYGFSDCHVQRCCNSTESRCTTVIVWPGSQSPRHPCAANRDLWQFRLVGSSGFYGGCPSMVSSSYTPRVAPTFSGGSLVLSPWGALPQHLGGNGFKAQWTRRYRNRWPFQSFARQCCVSNVFDVASWCATVLNKP